MIAKSVEQWRASAREGWLKAAREAWEAAELAASEAGEAETKAQVARGQAKRTTDPVMLYGYTRMAESLEGYAAGLRASEALHRAEGDKCSGRARALATQQGAAA